MVDVSQLLNVVATASIVLGALFAVAELRGLAKDRRTELVMNVWSTFTDPDFAEAHCRIDGTECKDLKDIVDKCTRADILKLSQFYEGLGLLVRKRLVDPQLVLEMSYPRIIWAKLKPWMDDERLRVTKLRGEHFEYLAELDTQYKTRRLAELKGV